MYADFWKKYDGRISYRQRIDTVIQWLQLSEKIRPHLIMFYFSEPDYSGHAHGPASDYTGMAVKRLDSLAGILTDELDRLPVGRKINLIITSDHGMAAVSPEKTVFLSDYLPAHWVEKQFTGAWVSAGRQFSVPPKGAHGYDNECKDMHAIFFVRGPAFKRTYSQAPFVNVDLYNLMAAVLNLRSADNDGDFERVKGMLKKY
jgi:alkaline phosphatase D